MKFEEYTPPHWDKWFMTLVYLTATKSKDPSSKVGAVLVKDNRIISTGYNGFPMGVNDSEERYKNRPLKYQLVVHAEHNAILSAARFGISTIESTLYTQGLPCSECMKSVINSGVKRIVVHKNWPVWTHSNWEESEKISKLMLEESGVEVVSINEKLSTFGYLNGEVFEV